MMGRKMISILLSSGRITVPTSMVPNSWKKMWDKWDVHGVILLSLFLQIFLVLFASSRKRIKGFLLQFIWLAYLLADWAASYCVGLISNNQKSHSTKTRKDHLLAFWSPFLLLHLGGPDTITAYALEDNELWLRHLLSLIFQSTTAAYIFFLTVEDNSLLLPTLLVFVAGLIKYAERTRALYIASFNAVRQSLVPPPGPDYGKVMEKFYSLKRARLPAQIVTIPEPDTERTQELPGEDGSHQGENDQLEAVQKGYFFFKMFKGVIVDMIYSFDDRRKSRNYFSNKSPDQALQVIEIELNFMYEAFYTKFMIVRQWFGCCCKFVSFTSVMLALGLFIFEEKHGLDEFDIGVTYALLYGALALETIALFMLIVTEHTAILPQKSRDLNEACTFQGFMMRLLQRFNDKMLVRFFKAKEPKWEKIDKGKPYEGYERLATPVLYRRWYGSISGFNLVKYSLDMPVQKIPYRLNESSSIARFITQSVQDGLYKVAPFCGISDLIDQGRFKDDNPMLKELWKYIFSVLKKRADEVGEEDAEMVRRMCCVRGEWAMERESRDSLKPFVDPNEVAFDQSLILWHIATSLCYYSEEEDKRHDLVEERDYSMILSDYLIYLLIGQPAMMSSVAGIGQIRFQTAYEEAKRFFSRRNLEHEKDDKTRLRKACKDIVEVLKDVESIYLTRECSISLLFDACRLAKELKSLEVEEHEKWKIIGAVWVELLSFAATQCRPTAHVRVLSEGGELLSLVWLLMIHLGLGNFQFREPRTSILVAQVLPS